MALAVASREFLIGDPGEPVLETLRDALAPRFGVVADGRARTVARTWLDTFDWRLQRAGLTLTYTTAHGHGELSLTTADGTVLTAPAGNLRWPALTDALPPGPVRARLEPVAKVRALLPTVRAVSTTRRLRACNSDQKTVAWLAVDHPTAVHLAPASPAALATPGRSGAVGPGTPAGVDLPTRVQVTAIRGYLNQASQIAESLDSAPGMTPAGQPAWQAALTAAGQSSTGIDGKAGVRLTAAMPGTAALSAVLAGLLQALEANVTGTLRDIDTEFLHDLRIAVRRTRTALKLGGGALPGTVAEEFRREFKWLGDATTPTRDLDVHLLNYPGLAASLTAATPEDLAPFHDHLMRRRATELRRLTRALRSARFVGLMSSWQEALSGFANVPGTPTAAKLASGILGTAGRRVITQGRAIGPSSPPENLHDLRKRCKELRYALEFFAPLCDPAGYRLVVKELKGLQDCLGEYQDCEVQRAEIQAMAAEMMASGSTGAATLLAMGELAGQLGQRERDARAEFGGKFASFAAPASERRLASLVRLGAGQERPRARAGAGRVAS